MMIKRLVCIGLPLMSSVGCQGLLHELQTHRLGRVNYYNSASRTDEVLYSLPDPLDVPIQTNEETEAADSLTDN